MYQYRHDAVGQTVYKYPEQPTVTEKNDARGHLSASEFVDLEREISMADAQAVQRRNAQKQASQPSTPRVEAAKSTQAVVQAAAAEASDANGQAALKQRATEVPDTPKNVGVDVTSSSSKKPESRRGKGAVDPGPDDLPRVDPLKLR